MASHVSSKSLENEAYLKMFQLSGAKFTFLNEFLSFDYNTDLYENLTEKEKENVFKMLSFPYQPL